MGTEIKEFGKKFAKAYKKILQAIQKFDKIAIFRHIIPDYDALGSQLGLANWIKDNFPKKDIKVLGDNHVTFTPRLFPEMDCPGQEWFNEPFLAIIVDVANASRVADPRYEKAAYSIKIDHHPEVEKFTNISVVETKASAASEILVNMVMHFGKKRILTREAAGYFYAGLAGDSGRFQYSTTSSHTFEIASILTKSGIDLSKIYQKMYMKTVNDLKVTSYVLNHYSISDNGVAYYVLNNDALKELGITPERGKENVNIFSNIEGINVWCSVTEDIEDKVWRVSIRSKDRAINEVASQFNGGGHAQAAGATLYSIDELPDLIKALDQLFC